jgi:NDP-sugar pyrophosphorylase family protein
MTNSSKPVYLDTIDRIDGVSSQPDFNNPPPRKVISQDDYDRAVLQSEHKLDHFIFIPENWDLSEIEPNTSKPHHYAGNNYIPNNAIPDGSVVGFKSQIQSSVALKNVKIGYGVELGDNIILENCRVDDFVTMGHGVYLENTIIGNGVIAASIENISGCNVGYNFDCVMIEEIGPGNTFERDLYTQKVGTAHRDNHVKTVSNTKEAFNIDDFVSNENSLSVSAV